MSRTIVVPPGGSIQAAINQAGNGDTIRVAAGTYRESLTINKSIRLIGTGTKTILTAGAGNAITLAQGSSGSTIQNFNIQNSRAGIITIPDVPVRNVVITQNRFSGLERYAVLVSYGASNFQVTKNQIERVNVGVQMLTSSTGKLDNINVSNNTIRDVTGIALYLNTLINTPGSAGAITLSRNQISQDIGKIGNNLSLITLQFARPATHGQVQVLNNTLTFVGKNQSQNRGLYGIRVAGNVNALNVRGNNIQNQVKGNLPILSGGIWVDAEDSLYGKIPGTARLAFTQNRFTALDAPIFYDGVLSPGIRFNLSGNVYNPFAGSGLGDIFGGTGKVDVVTGKTSNDILFGANAADVLSGAQGNDSLLGEAGNDVLNGGEGRDQIVGGSGQDTLTGGADNDLFVFERLGGGVDVITDFTPGADTIELKNLLNPAALATPSQFSDFVQFKVRNNATQVLVDANGALKGKNFKLLARLEGVTTNQPTAADFVFNVRGTNRNDTLIGTAANDFFTGGLGKDTLTGGAGLNQFIYLSSDLTSPTDSSDVITDFKTTQDIINLQDIVKGAAYQSANPFADYVRLIQQGANTVVQVTPDGDALLKTFKPITVLQGVNAATLTASNFSFY